MPGLFSWIVALVIAGIVLASRRQKARSRELGRYWGKAAKELGFVPAHRGTRLALKGKSGQLEATIDLYSDGNSTTTRYRAGYPSLGLGLSLTRQAGVQGLLKTLGVRDIEVGDPDFDARFIVKGADPDQVIHFFTPERTRALSTLATDHPGLKVTDEYLLVTTPGTERDPQRIVATARQVMEAAATLTGDDDPEMNMTAALAADTEEGTILEREVELAAVLDAADEYAGHREAEDHPVLDADAHAAALRLFGDHQLSFEVERIFTAEFLDRTVTWSGTVEREAGASADSIFDEEDVSAVIVQIATLHDDLYGSVPVEAVVRLVTDEPSPGSRIRFRGRLIQVDGVMKRIYVADAGLV